MTNPEGGTSGQNGELAERLQAFVALAADNAIDDDLVKVQFLTLTTMGDGAFQTSYDALLGTRPVLAANMKDAFSRLWQFQANCLDKDPDLFFTETATNSANLVPACIEFGISTTTIRNEYT